MNISVKDNVLHVLANITTLVQEGDEDYAEVWAEVLECGLNELQSEDFFGTEGQNDPRGDWRDIDVENEDGWSVWNPQGRRIW